MSDLNFQNELKPDFRDKPLYGWYRGVVLNNRDKDLEKTNYGRVYVHIPTLFDEPSVGVWALPGNNPIGGRNTESISDNKDSNGGKQEYTGSAYIPANNSWVWIFFEGGNPSRPYYANGCDIKAHELPPEMCVQKGSKPEERWLIFRSPHGRVIMVSDDPANCRIEITGKKRTSPGNTDSHVYDIDGNQKTILIDDREGKEKIIIKDEKGNFINMRTHKDDIDVHCNKICRIFAGEAIYLKAPHIGIHGVNSLHIKSPDMHTNLGSDNSLPDQDPNGERNE